MPLRVIRALPSASKRCRRPAARIAHPSVQPVLGDGAVATQLPLQQKWPAGQHLPLQQVAPVAQHKGALEVPQHTGVVEEQGCE